MSEEASLTELTAECLLQLRVLAIYLSYLCKLGALQIAHTAQWAPLRKKSKKSTNC